ncbi:MAG: hypothetical protein ACKVVT_09625 [Dehalococcoidia bacterium]
MPATTTPAPTDEAVREALAVLGRRGFTAGDLDFLLYEGQYDDELQADVEFGAALDVLSRRREAGLPVR